MEEPPTEYLVCPPDNDDVKAPIHSEETFILPSSKLTRLLELVDSVYEDKEVRFHWYLKPAVEVTASSYRNGDTEWMSSEMAHDSNLGTGEVCTSIKRAYG